MRQKGPHVRNRGKLGQDRKLINVRTSTKWRRSKGQARYGNRSHLVQATAGGSNTMPTRQHRELGQARRARMEYDSTQCWVLAKQEVLVPKHKNRERIIPSPHKAIKNIAIWAGRVEQHTHSVHVSTPRTAGFQLHATHRFQTLLLLPFSHCSDRGNSDSVEELFSARVPKSSAEVRRGIYPRHQGRWRCRAAGIARW